MMIASCVACGAVAVPHVNKCPECVQDKLRALMEIEAIASGDLRDKHGQRVPRSWVGLRPIDLGVKAYRVIR